MITALIIFGGMLGLYTLAVAVGFIWKPKLPTILFGIIVGPIRLENEQGGSVTQASRFKILIFQKPVQVFLDEEKYYVTHIQYNARTWYLLCWPMIFHFCFWQPRFQQLKPDPNDPKKLDPIPGSEIAFYGRLFGWRKQRPDPNGYIFSKGYPPFGHLD